MISSGKVLYFEFFDLFLRIYFVEDVPLPFLNSKDELCHATLKFLKDDKVILHLSKPWKNLSAYLIPHFLDTEMEIEEYVFGIEVGANNLSELLPVKEFFEDASIFMHARTETTIHVHSRSESKFL